MTDTPEVDSDTEKLSAKIAKDISRFEEDRKDEIVSEVNAKQTKILTRAVIGLAVLMLAIVTVIFFIGFSVSSIQTGREAAKIAQEEYQKNSDEEVAAIEKNLAEINAEREKKGLEPITDVNVESGVELDDSEQVQIAQLAAALIPAPQDGKDGQNGVNGVSVVGASASGCNLVVALSDGSSETAAMSCPKGDQGEPGQNGISVVGAYSQGCSLVIVYSDGKTNTLPFQCLKGDTGPQGVSGPQGDVGEVGPQGEVGATGATGNGIASMQITDCTLVVTYTNGESYQYAFNCPQGVQGEPGVPGETGPKGTSVSEVSFYCNGATLYSHVVLEDGSVQDSTVPGSNVCMAPNPAPPSEGE